MKNLSVVIITLNEEASIGNILSDLAKQTWNKFEVIIVDSNSSDATVATAKEFTSTFKEFTVIEMKNRGVSLGRNTGAEHAKYERLLFLDADVRLASTFLEEAAFYLAKTETKVCTGAMDTAAGESLIIRTGIKAFY